MLYHEFVLVSLYIYIYIYIYVYIYIYIDKTITFHVHKSLTNTSVHCQVLCIKIYFLHFNFFNIIGANICKTIMNQVLHL